MKKTTPLIMLIAIYSFNARAQTNIFPPIGNVGIGTATPAAKLSFVNVDLDNSANGITWYNPLPLRYGIYRTAGTWAAPNYQQLKLMFPTGIILDPGTAYGKSYVDVQGGGLRINGEGAAPFNSTGMFQLNYSATTPYTGALIKNSGNASGSLAELTMYNNTGNTGIFFLTSSNYSLNANTGANCAGIYNNGTGGISFVVDEVNAPISFATNNTKRMTISPAGNVGIGTTTPDAKLAVNGTIHSKEVKVDLTGWPDYVFEEDYDLPSLEVLKIYIDVNKHLPEVPSACAVEENGVNLGEMNMLLLKKVEELTLYAIEQKERAELQQQQLERLQKQIDELLNNK